MRAGVGQLSFLCLAPTVEMPLRATVVAASVGNTKSVPSSAPKTDLYLAADLKGLCQVQFWQNSTETASLFNAS